jgi:hypothetical protein
VQEVHHPANAKQRNEKISEALQSVSQPFLIRFFCNNSHHRGGDQGEYDGDFEMRQI